MLKRTSGVLISALLLASCATGDFRGGSGSSFTSSDRTQDRNVNNVRGGSSRDFGTGE